MIPNSVADILKSKTSRALPRPVDHPVSDVASYQAALDNFHRVFAFRPGDHVVMLTDPLLDPRVVQAVYGLARARGATFAQYMGRSTQIMEVPDEAKAIIDRATYVVSTWFASVIDPYCVALRAKKGQRWIKITFFRNLDLLHTPQARFPIDVLGEIIRATQRLFPKSGAFDLTFTDARGTHFEIKYTEAMYKRMFTDNRWRGHNYADEDGCYVHYLPTHGPNFYEPKAVDNAYNGPVNGIVYPQWAVGFAEPFKEKIGVEFKDDRVVAVHGHGMEAEVFRDFLIGGRLEELGCGHNPKAPRFDIYPAGPNSPGALHFGINGLKPSDYIRRMMPNWEEPPVHMDLVTFDSTVTAGNQIIIDQGFLKSLRDPEVVKLAEKYGDPVDLLEAFPV
ncbi:MAG TPA: hypothetical protein VMV26_19980 [Alphaproteobacteria bacterium]|jgi:hypothetical protein|nr:hypothetical protein [Alphaproteobacteria bacterium]